MKQIAIDKANSRLAQAKEALELIKAAKNYEEFLSAWTDFLTYNNTIYNILEKGASGKAQSKQWFFSNLKKLRKDPLISYLIQARNSDEHGIEPITELKSGGIGIGVQDPSKEWFIKDLQIKNGKISVGGSSQPVVVTVTPPSAQLIPVKDDRYGTTFDPPTEHLGKKLNNLSPYEAGRLGYEFAETFIENAEKQI